jgi:hypothetical protein
MRSWHVIIATGAHNRFEMTVVAGSKAQHSIWRGYSSAKQKEDREGIRKSGAEEPGHEQVGFRTIRRSPLYLIL